MEITICDVLKTLVPENVYDDFINSVVVQYEIDTPLRVSHFLAQCAHESSDFQRTSENLNYSADRLLRVFPKYFDRRSARLYARRPVKIASRVYANRMGNGDEQSQEGWLYKGRGYIQLTGKENYQKLSEVVEEDIIADPGMVAIKYPLLSAAWFWKLNGLNELADIGTNIEAITRAVNGGTNGLQDRQIRFDQYYADLRIFEDEQAI